jgi:hypothetical protein
LVLTLLIVGAILTFVSRGHPIKYQGTLAGTAIWVPWVAAVTATTLYVARIAGSSFWRDNRIGAWLRLESEAAQQVVAECVTERLAVGHARHRIQEALEYGESIGLDRFAATAMVYSGELPTALFTPYQTRLRTRYLLRHRNCDALGGRFLKTCIESEC